MSSQIQHRIESETHPGEDDDHCEQGCVRLGEPALALARFGHAEQVEEVVDPADCGVEHLAPHDRDADHPRHRGDEVNGSEDLHSGQLRGEHAGQHEGWQYSERYGQQEEDHDVLQRQPELDVACADDPVLAEPVEVDQYLIAAIQHLGAGVALRRVSEVDRQRSDVVLQPDEITGRVSGIPVEEADPE